MNTVILVHGVTDRPGRLAYMARYLTRRGWKVLMPLLRPSNGSAPIEKLAEDLKAFIDENTIANEQIDIIGFSMGGLISRYYLQFLEGAQRTERFISISTPHQGTRIACLFPGKGMHQMRPGSLFLQTLNKDLSSLVSISCTSIYTPLDLIILPAKSSLFPLAQTTRLLIPAHPLMIYHPKVFKTLTQILSSPILV